MTLRLVALLVLATLVGGCGSGSVTVAQQVSSWAHNSRFNSELTTLRGDLARVSAQGAQTGSPLRTVCDVLVTDALSANQELPTPDHTLTTLLSVAYGLAASAGRDCYRAAGGEAVVLALSAAERAKAASALIRAEARFDAITSMLPAGS